MPLSTNQDTLRIPAFMRKRNLRNRGKSSLLLTALDRKKAKVAPNMLASPKKKTRNPRFLTLPFDKPESQTKRLRKPKQFASPLIQDTYTQPKSRKIIGEITRYYDKIRVGVVKLKRTLTVGDSIAYKTSDGEINTQIVESMEIDRSPVFRATKGDEIGIKLQAVPRVGCLVTK